MFHPPFCPRFGCPSAERDLAFRYRRSGTYHRKCDGRWIQRFRCLVCHRGFSTQTYKSNYRYRKPFLHHALVHALCSKVTRRQAARLFGVNKKTVERRFVRMAQVARDFHLARLRECREVGGIDGTFQLDELETFEHHRKLKPVTMAVLIERKSYFIVHTRAGQLAARGRRTEAQQERLEEIQKEEGKRRSASRACVRECFEALGSVLASHLPIRLQTDKKRTYPTECKRANFPRALYHRTTDSRKRRDYRNLLFPINHTLAMMRDGMSCLVRRSWGAAKRIKGLQRHAWLWTAYRNYVRGVTVKTRTTPAQSAGVCDQRWQLKEVLRWRWPLRMAQQ